MICIVMEEPLKDGEIGNIRENLKDFIHLEQLPPAIWYVDADYPYKTVNKPYFVKSYKSLGRNKGRYYTYNKCPIEKHVTIKAIFQMAMHIRNCLTYGGRFTNWR